jgi:hypothetical protein
VEIVASVASWRCPGVEATLLVSPKTGGFLFRLQACCASGSVDVRPGAPGTSLHRALDEAAAVLLDRRDATHRAAGLPGP